MPSQCATCFKSEATSMCSRCKCTYYCNSECQRKDWKQHKKICKRLRANRSEPKPKATDDEKVSSKTPKKIFRIEQIEGKGLGMLAHKDICAGTMLLNENPILSLTSDTVMDVRSMDIKTFTKEFAKPLLQRFKELSKKDQIRVNALSHKYDGSVLDIFLNNSLTNEDKGFDGVYLNISRINHSCNANCLHWIESKDRGFNTRIIALRDIDKNEEITIDYLGWQPMQFNERKDKLKSGWNIEKCQCMKCDTKQRREAWDSIILRYKRLDESIPKILDPNTKYKACKEIVQLVKSEYGSNAQLLYRHCWDLTNAAMLAMKGDELIENLVNTVKYKRLAHGKDTEVPKEVSDLIEQMPKEIQKDVRRQIRKIK